MGPIIINADGTTRRITNWHGLIPAERSTALRRIAARNKDRIAALKKQHAEL